MDVVHPLGIRRETGSSRWWYRPVKRGLDLVLSATLLALLSPVFAICAVAIRLDSRGPVIFRQQRLGEGGKTFTMLKFRTMIENNDPSSHREYITKLIRGEAPGQDSGAGTVYKIVDDPRVTRTGRWLRRTSLDELPQLWNVLRGSMSLVGPRPPLSYEVEQYQPAQLRRLGVKPGMTGWWQVNGRSRTSFEQMIALDLEYVENQSVTLDLRILLKTVPSVVFGRGAH